MYIKGLAGPRIFGVSLGLDLNLDRTWRIDQVFVRRNELVAKFLDINSDYAYCFDE